MSERARLIQHIRENPVLAANSQQILADYDRDPAQFVRLISYGQNPTKTQPLNLGESLERRLDMEEAARAARGGPKRRVTRAPTPTSPDLESPEDAMKELLDADRREQIASNLRRRPLGKLASSSPRFNSTVRRVKLAAAQSIFEAYGLGSLPPSQLAAHF